MGAEPANDPGSVAAFAPALLDGLPDAILLLDAEGTVLYANVTFVDDLGIGVGEVVGRNLLDMVHPDDADYVIQALTSRLASSGRGPSVQFRILSATGTWRPFEVVGKSLLEVAEVGGVVVSMRELTSPVAVADSPARLRALVNNSADLTMLVDADLNLEFATVQMSRLLGRDPDPLVGSGLLDLVHLDDRDGLRVAIADLVAGDDRRLDRRVRLLRDDGAEVLFDLRIADHVDDDVLPGILITGHDLSELAAAEKRSAELEELLRSPGREPIVATDPDRDPLTGLSNRAAFLEAIEAALVKQADEQSTVALVCCDIESFGALNDEFGRAAGDAVLLELAGRLEAALDEADLVARFGADEFAVLSWFDGLGDVLIARLLERVEPCFQEPVVIAGTTHELGASIGYSLTRHTDLPMGSAALLARADRAMYRVRPLDAADVENEHEHEPDPAEPEAEAGPEPGAGAEGDTLGDAAPSGPEPRAEPSGDALAPVGSGLGDEGAEEVGVVEQGGGGQVPPAVALEEHKLLSEQ